MKVPGEHIDKEETFAMNATVLVVLVVALLPLLILILIIIIVVVVVVVIVVVLIVVLPGPNTKNIEVVHHNQVKKLQRRMMWNRRQ
jgi:accessory gene regulator protein AgrB